MRTSYRRLALAGICGLLFLLPYALPAFASEPVPIAPDTYHWRIYRPEGPWAINVVEVDPSEPYLRFESLLGGGATVGRRALTQMLAERAADAYAPVAAINGDFFAMAGGAYTTIPLGFQVADGELVTFPDPSRSVFYIAGDGTPHIDRFRANAWLLGPDDLLYPISGMNRPPERGELVLFTPRFGAQTRAADSITQFTLSGLSGPIRLGEEASARVEAIAVRGSTDIPAGGAVLAANGVAAYGLRRLKVGDEVRIRAAVEPDVDEVRLGIGGGPRLVRDGRVSVESAQERFKPLFASRRHPRTGVGIRGGTVMMVTVDGRQPGYSEGMTLPEFAQLFIDLGCSDAMNLDGGGSTTMVVRNQLVNSPSEGTERRIANALALFCTAPPTDKPVRLAIEPAEANILSGERLPLVARGLDEYYNPVRVDQRAIKWQCGGLGTVDDQGYFNPAPVTAPTAGLITASYGGMSAATVVCVVPAPAQLSISPDRTSVALGATQRFVVHAYDEEHRPIRVAESRVAWSCEPESAGASIDARGVLKAPPKEAELRVIARIGEVSAAAEVMVGVVTAVLTGFEEPGAWTYSSTETPASGAVSVIADPLNPANHCLRLDYDFSRAVETRAAHAVLNLPLPDTRTISVRVLGDAQGAWLRARLRDAADRRFTVDLSPRIDWSGQWRKLGAWLPDGAASPVTLESIYLVEYHADHKPAGAIYIDDIGTESLPGKARNSASQGKADGATSADAPSGGEESRMPELPTYTCRRTSGPVTIDGKLDEPVWSRALSVGDFRFTDGKGEPQLPTEVKLCWDDANLYLAFVAIDTDIWGTLRNRDDLIYEEEVVEAFLSSGGEVTKYYELEWSPHNVLFDARMECPEEGDRSRMKTDLAWNCEGHRSAVQVVGTLDKRDDIDQQWTVEVALPFSAIGRKGRPPVDGERWRANFYRIDRAGEGEFSCWSPTLKGDFHVPARFGHIVFSHENW